MLNRIILMGRLTRDPELRHTQTGTPVASFSLAVDRDFKDKTTGEKSTDFIDIVAWRQTAEFVSRFFTKGRMAVVEGRLQLRDWTDRDGNKRRTGGDRRQRVLRRLQAGRGGGRLCRALRRVRRSGRRLRAASRRTQRRLLRPHGRRRSVRRAL